jgi:hypothetical protein
VDSIKEQRIRARAYQLWQQAGQPEGQADEYWYQAQAEIEAEAMEPGNERPGTVPREA